MCVVAEGSGRRRKLLIGELRSPQIIRMMSWAGYLAHKKFHSEDMKGRDQVGYEGMYERQILRWDLTEYVVLSGVSLMVRPVVGCVEHGNEPLDSVKSRPFIDHRSDHLILGVSSE